MLQEDANQLGYWFDPDEEVVWEECEDCHAKGVVPVGLGLVAICGACDGLTLVPHGCGA